MKVDRASMAHSLEVRAPILDHKLMELAASMPSSMKLRGTNGKYIFKKALKQVLPESVLHRKKMGFAVPLAHWFRGDLKELAHGVIFSRNRDGLLNESTVSRVWKEHQSGLCDHSTELWALLIFRLWQRQFMTLSSGKAEDRSPIDSINRMKVLVFTSLYPNNVWPNHGVFIKERMSQFAKLEGCEVKVIAPVPYFPALKLNWRWRFSQVVRLEVRDGIEVHHPR